MSVVRINQGAINDFFSRSPIAGSGLPGLRTGTPELVAARMVRAAKSNASGGVVQRRTGELANSVRPIVRRNIRTGAVEVGVGTVSEYGGYLEHGTPPHQIPKQILFRGVLASDPRYARALRHPVRSVQHPGFAAKPWLRKAVESVSRGV